MKPKRLMLVFFFVLQMTVSGAALAWSPLDSAKDAVEKWYSCNLVVASSDDAGETKPKNEQAEEEPDCD